MKRVGLFWRLFPSYLIIAVIALGGMYFYASYKITDFYYLRSEKNLESNALLVKHFFFENGKIKNKAEIDGICKTLYKDSGVRITIITPAGVVLGDSMENPARMENHSDRPEVIRRQHCLCRSARFERGKNISDHQGFAFRSVRGRRFI
jgi:two-component system phosphate regulon sensor histidine kinase PhoR